MDISVEIWVVCGKFRWIKILIYSYWISAVPFYWNVNYKKEDDDTITLYFNYNNFLASPYLKLNNGKTKTDIIPNTYLKLKSGESGILDIMLQFKYYERTELYGYKNVILVSYEIHNTSDDKPKFLIRKIKQAERDSYKKYES